MYAIKLTSNNMAASTSHPTNTSSNNMAATTPTTPRNPLQRYVRRAKKSRKKFAKKIYSQKKFAKSGNAAYIWQPRVSGSSYLLLSMVAHCYFVVLAEEAID